MHSRFPVKILASVILRCPGLAGPLVSAMYRKHIGTRHDYRRGTGEALRPPAQISLRITNACNHRCAVCGQYGRHGYMNGPGRADRLRTLSLDVYRKLVEEAAPYRPIFYITGGEPFLYPQFPELVRCIKEHDCVVSVVTNGSLLERDAAAMVDAGLDMVLVSFDGPREIHDRCRNHPGAYDDAVRGILALGEEKRNRRSVRPFVLTSTTVSGVNAPALTETFGIGCELRPDLMVVYLSWFTSGTRGKAHADILSRELGVEAFTWESYATGFSPEEAASFRDALDEVCRRKWPFEYLVVPNLAGEDIARYYTDPAAMFGYSRCVAPFLMMDIMPDGEVVTCRDYIDVSVGNITETPLLDIWNGAPFVRFRKLLLAHGGLLPQCSRCCGLMGF